MPSEKESLPAVTIAGIVAIILALFLAFGSFVAGLGLLLMPQIQPSSGVAPMPAGAPAMMALVLFFFFALSVFGIFVGVNVIRRRNWARITMLVWGGIMVPFCLLLIVSTMVVFSVMPDGLPGGASVSDPASFLRFMKFSIAIFYGIPVVVGIWWLILFSRKRVADAFTVPSQPALPAMDASGFPHPADFTPAAPSALSKRPTCPLPLTVLAVFFLFSCACMLLILLVRLPSAYAMPTFWFGYTFSGSNAKLFAALLMFAMGAASFAMLRLKSWGLHALLALQALYLINGTFMMLSPAFMSQMGDAMAKASSAYPGMAAGNPFVSENYIRTFMAIGLMISLFILALLVFYRSRFLEAANTAKTQPS